MQIGSELHDFLRIGRVARHLQLMDDLAELNLGPPTQKPNGMVNMGAHDLYLLQTTETQPNGRPGCHGLYIYNAPTPEASGRLKL